MHKPACAHVSVRPRRFEGQVRGTRLGTGPRTVGPARSLRPLCPHRHFNCSSPGAQACSLPASCCIRPREDAAAVSDPCGLGALGLDEEAAQRVVHLQGCGPLLRGWLRRSLRATGVYAIAVVAVQGAELLLAAGLLRALAVRKGLLQSSRTAGTGAPRERPPA